jgi:hypothetical protein
MSYTHKVTRGQTICSEHTSLANAQKQVARLVRMSRGKLTAADFQIVEVTP